MVFNSKFIDEIIEKEKIAVRSELIEIKDSPADYINHLAMKAVFGNQGGFDIDKQLRCINKITRKDLIKFWKKFYCPNNAVLVVSGPIFHKNVLCLAKEHIGSLKKKKLPVLSLLKGNQSTKKVSLLYKDTSQIYFALACKTVSYTDDLKASLSIARECFNGSELESVLFRPKGVYTILSADEYHSRTGIFYLSTAVDKKYFSNILEFIINAINKISKGEFGDKDLQWAKDKARDMSKDNLETMEKVQEIGEEELLYGGCVSFKKFIEKVNKVSKEDIQNMVGNVMSMGKLKLIVIGKFKDVGYLQKLLDKYAGT